MPSCGKNCQQNECGSKKIFITKIAFHFCPSWTAWWLGKSHSLENSPQVYHFIILNPASSRPPAAVLQHPLTLSRPPPADIMSRLQSLTPIRPIICRLQTAAVQESITDTYDESDFFREFDQVSFSENLISYDASEFLREIDFFPIMCNDIRVC